MVSWSLVPSSLTYIGQGPYNYIFLQSLKKIGRTTARACDQLQGDRHTADNSHQKDEVAHQKM